MAWGNFGACGDYPHRDRPTDRIDELNWHAEGAMADTKKSGYSYGKSNKLGFGGRAAQLKAQGVPGGVIGEIARSKGAAPGQKNFHKK